MSKKQIWVFALYGIWLLCITAHCIWSHDWCNLIWNWVACAYLLLVVKLMNTIDKQDVTIRFLKGHNRELKENAGYKRFLEADRRANIYFDNLERALKNMIKLKEANKQLHILNNNLIEHQYAGKHKGKKK